MLIDYDLKSWGWLFRLRFWLAPTYCTIDLGYSRCDPKAILWFKVIDDQIFIIRQITKRK